MTYQLNNLSSHVETLLSNRKEVYKRKYQTYRSDHYTEFTSNIYTISIFTITNKPRKPASSLQSTLIKQSRTIPKATHPPAKFKSDK